MGLGNQNKNIKYLSVKKGKIAHYDKESKTDTLHDYVEGFITAHKFELKEIQGEKKEFMTLTIVEGDEQFFLQIGVNSGYFRAFVNQLKSGSPDKKVRLTPQYSEEGTKKNSSMFVAPAGDMQKSFPWYAKKADMKDVPPAKAVTVNNKVIYDTTEQLAYWKKWLDSVKWASEFESSAVQYPDTSHEAKATANSNQSETVKFDDDDEPGLPF